MSNIITNNNSLLKLKPENTTMEEGKPLRIHELDIEALATWLMEHNIRTSQGKLIRNLHESHKEILRDPARYKVIAAGRRFGKSLISSLIALAVLMQINRRVWIVAPDYALAEKVFRELYNILVTQLKFIQPGKPGKGRARYQKGDFYLQTPWGSVLEAKSAENPDSLAGEANDLIIFDEAGLIPNVDEIWTQMLQPTLMDKEGSALFISTPRGKNGFYRLYKQGELGKKQLAGIQKITVDERGNSNDMTLWSSFKKTSYDNPLISTTPEKSRKEIDNAYREAILAGRLVNFKQEYLADFEAVSDSCFPKIIIEPTEKDPYPNVIDYEFHPDNGPVFAACDHNYAKPASTIFAQVNNYGDVVIFDERFTRKTDSYMQAQQIVDVQDELNAKAISIYKKEGKSLYNLNKVVIKEVIADISGRQAQLSGRTAWDDMEIVLGKRPVGRAQKRESGINMIRLWLSFPQFDRQGKPLLSEDGEQITRPKLFISRNCVNTIYALETAKFKKGKNGDLKEDYEETPEGYEGLIDALRYLLVYLFHDSGKHITLIKGIQ